MVDFEWYRSFIAIFKHNSVSEAAKTRIMTQPALSQHLACLESEVGEPLFIRTSRKMVPTERGKQLYSHLAPLIESLEEKTMSLKLHQGPTMNPIKIGATPELFTENILPHLSRLKLDTTTYFGDAEQLLELLKEERVDLILTNQRFLTPGIEYVRLMEESFVIVAPLETAVPDFTLLKEKERWLSEQKWISYGLELPIIRRYWKEFFKKGPLINPAHVIPSMHLILKAVEEGAGMSLLPTHILKHQNGTNPRWKFIFEDLKVHNEIFIGFKSKHKHVLIINEFIQRVSEEIRDEPRDVHLASNSY
ncbi:LysR family transcriptional regulator [Paenibacillus sp. CGMCC 1.16610]|uniref:LysR family transcriptional regulator n=1 Tax=Paenibacillus anseongense TaxID=2682845 RepID=A0ABW9UIC3_9BACL|nr:MULTISPECIES: LysR family transcriptional regulator [Paenibacillus]MBA2939412.1 LysR family transcriptional regulator [Paenibacillus sp. CGMCC 1.16610]MVQ39076.1 LysR family transcriptional regulator [Paenibacillus anseongense]